MPLYTTDSLTLSAGTHGDSDRFPTIVDHIYNHDHDIIALEYNPERLIEYLTEGFRNGSSDYPVAGVYLAIHAAADTDTPLALIDTADTIPQDADDRYDSKTINNAINHTSLSPYKSRPYAVSRQAVAEIRARHPNDYIEVLASRDRHMAGHLQYLRNKNLDIFGVVGGNHLPGIVDRLTGIVPLSPELCTAPPIRTELPALHESDVPWVHRWIPDTTHPAKASADRQTGASKNTTNTIM